MHTETHAHIHAHIRINSNSDRVRNRDHRHMYTGTDIDTETDAHEHVCATCSLYICVSVFVSVRLQPHRHKHRHTNIHIIKMSHTCVQTHARTRLKLTIDEDRAVRRMRRDLNFLKRRTILIKRTNLVFIGLRGCKHACMCVNEWTRVWMCSFAE